MCECGVCVYMCVYGCVHMERSYVYPFNGPSGTTNFFTTEILDALVILHVPSPEEERVRELNS